MHDIVVCYLFWSRFSSGTSKEASGQDDEAKKRARAGKFGTGGTSDAAGSSKDEDDAAKKKQARAERFGLPVSGAKDDESATKEARAQKFGTGKMEDPKMQARAEKFKPLASASKAGKEAAT